VAVPAEQQGDPDGKDKRMNDLELGVIGNCSFSALIDANAEIVWTCMPRFDSDPIFCKLLQGDREKSEAADHTPESTFAVEMLGLVQSTQRYIPNTAILVTQLFDDQGNAAEVIDFAPRFKQYGRTFRPIVLVRRIRALSGAPQIRLKLRPTVCYGKDSMSCVEGSNHISYVCGVRSMRLTTNASITAVIDERPFVLNRQLALIFGPDEAPKESATDVAEKYYTKTLNYWRD